MKCIYYISCFISHFPCICSVQYFHYACYQEAARSRWILKLRYVDSFSIKTISSTHFSFHFHVLQISSHSLVWALLLKKKKKKRNKSNFTDQIYHWCELSLSFKKISPCTRWEFLFLGMTPVSRSLCYKSDWNGAGNYNFHPFFKFRALTIHKRKIIPVASEYNKILSKIQICLLMLR